LLQFRGHKYIFANRFSIAVPLVDMGNEDCLPMLDQLDRMSREAATLRGQGRPDKAEKLQIELLHQTTRL
jgi:hypothetical protein